MAEQKLGIIAVVALLVGVVVGGGAAMVVLPSDQQPSDGPSATDGPNTSGVDRPGFPSLGAEGTEANVSTFEDASAFQQYLSRASADNAPIRVVNQPQRVTMDTDVNFDGDGGNGNGGAPAVREQSEAMAESATTGNADGGSQSSDRRTSDTNVQVAGIDEPDVLKTASDHLYYARQPQFARPHRDELSGPVGTTHIFDTADPAMPGEVATINTSGDLLRTDDRLVVFEGDRLVGYDVSDPADPEQTWTRPVNGTVETARLLNGSVYLVTSSGVSMNEPCPIEPVGEDASIACTDIYHPRQPIDVDATYSAFRIDPADGDVTDNVSFVGTRQNTAVYMSSNALYMTYTQRADRSALVVEGLLSDEIDTPLWVDERLREIKSYNLSARARSAEVDATIQQWIANVDQDRRADKREEIHDAIQSYVKQNRRQLTTSGVVRVNVGSEMTVESVGEVPGEPLNQFSMDEHNGTLRIATTIPRQFGLDSENDLYTLDAKNLNQTGEVTGMGVDQRVYAVRYVGETAYVVTFRQIDPFHVVDLSDPTDPEEVGELELPGFSSYLHPVDDTHVLGIGQENGDPKAVLFDVSDPSNPTIDDTYFFDAGWSAIEESHHAFLMDRRHEVFFLPGDQSGFVIDYTDDELSLKKEVSIGGQPQRAAYVGDHMYVFSDRELAVVDETDWSVVNRTSLLGPTSDEPKEAVEAFFDALDSADAEALEAQLHPESEEAQEFGRFLTDEEARERMNETDITVESVEVLSQSGDVAQVEAIVVADSEGDRDRNTDVFTLRRSGEEWLIWSWH